MGWKADLLSDGVMFRNFEIYTEFENKRLGLPPSQELLLGNETYCNVTSSKKNICFFSQSVLHETL